MEERRVGRIEVFGRHVGAHGAAAEGDDPAAQILDREHDAVAEAVVRHGHVLARDEEPRLDHHLDGYALAGEVVAQGEAVARRIADAEGAPGLGAETAPVEVFTRPRSEAPGQGALEEPCRELGDVVERLALLVLGRGLPRGLRHRDAGFARETLDGLGKG